MSRSRGAGIVQRRDDRRGLSMWGRDLKERYPDALDFVGLCDINSKRVEIAKKSLGVSCPTFTDFDKMCDTVKPELLTITTVDAFHSEIHQRRRRSTSRRLPRFPRRRDVLLDRHRGADEHLGKAAHPHRRSDQPDLDWARAPRPCAAGTGCHRAARGLPSCGSPRLPSHLSAGHLSAVRQSAVCPSGSPRPV